MKTSQRRGQDGSEEALDSRQVEGRAREVVVRLVREGVRRTGSQRQTAELLGSMGFRGRGGDPIRESTVSGWVNGRNPPTAVVLMGLVLYHRLSVDEVAHGTGLRAEVEALRGAQERAERSIRGLAGILTRHLTQQLDDDAAAEVRRLAEPDPAG